MVKNVTIRRQNNLSDKIKVEYADLEECIERINYIRKEVEFFSQ
jgi:hypothetical protein